MDKIEKEELVYDPYLGIGEKPHSFNKKKRIYSEEYIEKIIGG